MFSDALIRDAFNPLSYEIRDTFEEAARITAEEAPEVFNELDQPIRFGFDVANPAVAQFIRAYDFSLIREITLETRQVVAQVINDGVMRGDNPLTVARSVRQTIGLTVRQEAAVQNYKRLLQQDPAAALRRGLRDRRYDRSVLGALRNNKDLTNDVIERMTERYRSRYLKFRSEAIARTEAVRAVSFGNHEAWKQQVEVGLVKEEQVKRFWKYTHDGKTREAHTLIPSMNKEGVGLNETFRSILGPILFPGDPAATASNTVNCRCTVFTRIVTPE